MLDGTGGKETDDAEAVLILHHDFRRAEELLTNRLVPGHCGRSGGELLDPCLHSLWLRRVETDDRHSPRYVGELCVERFGQTVEAGWVRFVVMCAHGRFLSFVSSCTAQPSAQRQSRQACWEGEGRRHRAVTPEVVPVVGAEVPANVAAVPRGRVAGPNDDRVVVDPPVGDPVDPRSHTVSPSVRLSATSSPHSSVVMPSYMLS